MMNELCLYILLKPAFLMYNYIFPLVHTVIPANNVNIYTLDYSGELFEPPVFSGLAHKVIQESKGDKSNLKPTSFSPLLMGCTISEGLEAATSMSAPALRVTRLEKKKIYTWNFEFPLW